MKKGIQWCLIVGCMWILGIAPGRAADDKLSLEITPYLWMVGVDADVTVGNRTATAEADFDDLVDYVDGAFSFLAVGEYKRWVGWSQLDNMNMSADKATSDLQSARLDNNSLFWTVAGGRRLNGFLKGSMIDVMAGIRYMHIENELTVGASVSEAVRDQVDGVVVLRPNFPFAGRWSFNPTLSVGAGESDLTYELQPQFQFDITKNWLLRAGYRRLFYRISGDRGRLEGTFHGLIFGAGYQF